jgi:hypothetical protein
MKDKRRSVTVKSSKGKRALPHAGKAAFLAAYASTGNITAAAKASGVHRSQHYDWLSLDPEYAIAFAAAHDEAADLLELEARRRALEGVQKPVIYQGELSFLPKLAGGQVVTDDVGRPILSDVPLTIREYSDTLLIFLMKGARPQVYRDNFKGDATPPKRTVADLSKISEAELAELDRIARKANS